MTIICPLMIWMAVTWGLLARRDSFGWSLSEDKSSNHQILSNWQQGAIFFSLMGFQLVSVVQLVSGSQWGVERSSERAGGRAAISCATQVWVRISMMTLSSWWFWWFSSQTSWPTSRFEGLGQCAFRGVEPAMCYGDLWRLTGNPMAARLGNKIDIPTAASEDELRNALGCPEHWGYWDIVGYWACGGVSTLM